VAFSPDGTTLATSGDDGMLRSWDLATRHQTGKIGPFDSATLVAFDPDGKTLAVGGNDGIVRLWDLATRPAASTPSAGSSRWRSARTARRWPAAATMTPFGCGT